MDAEFVEYLDEKFRQQHEQLRNLETHAQRVSGQLATLDGRVEGLEQRMEHIETSLDALLRSVDRFVKLHEDLKIEQIALRSDIDRIKAVLREKLGVQL